MSETPKPKTKCDRCEREDCELVEVENHKLIKPFLFKHLCLECESKRQAYIISETVRRRRQDRSFRVCELHQEIERIIPPAYRQARLWRLGSRFKEKMLKYDPQTGLVLYGPVGCGKTFAICALLRSILGSTVRQELFPKCERIGYEMLCLHIRDAFKSNSNKSELDVIQPYLNPQILALEDLGSNKPIGTTESDFSLRVVYVLLDRRLELQRTTFITTNKTLDNLRIGFDERISSRLSCLTWLGVGGSDKRVKQNGK